MKKKILLLLLLLPVFTYAETVCDINRNTELNDGSLVCDKEKNTTTVFKRKGYEILNNDVCKITCDEEIIFMIQPIRKVLAGTSFSYPLYASGERRCEAEYNVDAYENKIKDLVSKYEAAPAGHEKQTALNEITNYYSKKKACDEFTKEESEYEDKYQFDSFKVTLDVETSKSTIPYNYVFKEISEPTNSVSIEEVAHNACNYNETSKKCVGADNTTSRWVQISRVYGKYTAEDQFMENYTGELKSTLEGKVCNVGDRIFTAKDEISRPTANDPTDKGYSLKLTAINLDNDFEEKAKKNGLKEVKNPLSWNLNVDCWYQVKNLLFPQKTDENYDKYDGTGFEYRIIDTKNPFPNREPGANWKGKTSLITNSTMDRFIITLNRSSIQRIREYNDTNPYQTFNLTEIEGVPEKSTFIQVNDFIDRK